MASENQQLPATAPPTAASGKAKGQRQWLTLKEASEFLGVHFTTLRSWADSGEIQVFRTPGGHRRFSLADLRRFLEERAGRSATADAETMVTAVIQHVHQEMELLPREQIRWHYALDDQASQRRRQRGQQLFALALAFVLKPALRPRLLDEGRKLGMEYGYEVYASKVSLADAGRAVRFFRNQLIQAVQAKQEPDLLDADDLRIQQQIDLFLDEVLYAVLAGYDEQSAEIAS
ncbi:MAG: helix-turn-helix domain-containing protein [Caldilineaceae bacterium]|nr:helix-turn-helix domain-containing protein [Caldilineaceae bacterium]